MRWIDPEYESAISFLFIVIAGVLPWNFSYARAPGLNISAYHIRWWFGEMYYVSADLQGFNPLPHAIHGQQGTAVYPAHLLWGATTLVFATSLCVAIGLLVNEEWVSARIPVATVTGGQLFLTGLGYVVVNVWIMQRGLPGLYLPLGGLMLMVFGGVLLTNRRELPIGRRQVSTD